MRFPDAEDLRDTVPDLEIPTLHRVRYEPPTQAVEDVESAAREAIDELALDELATGDRVAVGLGSRGITNIDILARAIINGLQDRGLEPFVVPAMGSHGGGTPEGQRETLAELGLSEKELGCPVEDSMDTEVVGQTDAGWPVHHARSAAAADAWLVVNRVKPHTNFSGRIESGICKMATIGMGKQAGARTVHEYALRDGYVESIRGALDVLRAETPFLGGMGVVENFTEQIAHVEGIPAQDLPDAEVALLEKAKTYMPMLPFDDLDVLVVEQIGKDISGAGMDTNVIGRYRVLNAEEPETPDIKRIAVLGVTEASQGNGQGIGLADLTTRRTAEALELQKMYTNALTSASLSKAALPVVLPDDEAAVLAALSTIGPYDPETVRLAWIQDTEHLSEFVISESLEGEIPAEAEVLGRSKLVFEEGRARIE